jgi:hypothetical protein
MSNRYRIALSQGRESFQQVYNEDAELLQGFGLRLMSVSGGVRAAVEKEVRGAQVNPWNVIAMDDKTWGWLRPLLVELEERREELARIAAK